MRASMAHNAGAVVRSEFGLGNTTATAGSTGDATEADAALISRNIEGLGIATSLKVIVTYTAALGEGQTLTFALQLQDAADVGSSPSDIFPAQAARVVATGDSGGSTEKDTAEWDFDLGDAREAVRAQITPNLSRANTDTLAYSVTYLLGGFKEGVITKSPSNIGGADGIAIG